MATGRKNETAVPDEQIIAAMMANGSIQAAAEACGISPRTVYDRMGSRAFKAAYSAAKADLIRQAVLSMHSRMTEATDTIFNIMTDTGNPPATRLAAARVLLDNAAKFMDRLACEDGYTAHWAKSPLSLNPDSWD